MTVCILMATYNGADFIRMQLDSILAQTYTEWNLYIRDDNSTDDTLIIISEYQKIDSRIKLINYGNAHGSATANFGALVEYAVSENSQYVLFADQDDIWHSSKVAEILKFAIQSELKFGKDAPLCIYSLFQYIDVNDDYIGEEMKLPNKLTLEILLNQNYAYGCTMIVNNALLTKVKRIPKEAENHDYWIALIATAFGTALLYPEKLVLYRQHSNNVSGNLQNRKTSSRIHRYFAEIEYLLPALVKNLKMIFHFINLYKDSLGHAELKLLLNYKSAFIESNFALITFMSLHKFRKVGFFQTMAHYYTIFHLRAKIVKALD